jgi:hypothetical protein
MKTLLKALIGSAIIFAAGNAFAGEHWFGHSLRPHQTSYELIQAPEGKSIIKIEANGNMPITCEVLDIGQPMFITATDNKGKAIKWHGTTITHITFRSVFKQAHVSKCVGTLNLDLPRRFIITVHNDNAVELPFMMDMKSIPKYHAVKPVQVGGFIPE